MTDYSIFYSMHFSQNMSCVDLIRRWSFNGSSLLESIGLSPAGAWLVLQHLQIEPTNSLCGPEYMATL